MKSIFKKSIAFSWLLGFVLLILPLIAHSMVINNKAKLRNIAIYGNGDVSKKQIKSWLNLAKKQAIAAEDVYSKTVNVIKKLNAQGYYFAKLDSIRFLYNLDSSGVDVKFYFDVGQIPKVSELKIDGLNDVSLNTRFRTRAGKHFNPPDLEADIETIIRYFEEHGYPFCEVEIAELTLNRKPDGNESGVDIKLNVKSAERIKITQFKIYGNEQTRNQVILRELPIAPGDFYDQRKVDKISAILMNLGFFKWVNPSRIEVIKDSTARLIIELQEGNQNRFDGVLGYNPSTRTDKSFFTGLLDFQFGNLFGTGRKINAFWQRRSENTQELRLNYLEPWVAGFPINIGVGFEQIIQDTSYIEREVGLEAHYKINSNFSIFSNLSRRTISPDSIGALRFNILPSQALNLSAGFVLNTLIEPLNPTGGLKYQTSFKWSKKSVDQQITNDNQSFNQKSLFIDFDNYFPLFRWQVLALGLHGREITSDEAVLPITEQFRLGGASSLRGYREEQFRGSRIAWANLEYRYVTGPLSRLFVFFDLGYFFREDLTDINKKIKVDGVKYGYGFGLRIDTKVGFLGLDYGLGEGDNFSNGKVHIRLINDF